MTALPSDRAGRASPEPQSTQGLGHSATIPSAERAQRYFQALSAIAVNEQIEWIVRAELLALSLLEEREVKKRCRSCGAEQTDYRYDRITGAGRLLMEIAASGIEAGTAETVEQGSVHESPGPQDDAPTPLSGPSHDR